MNSRFEIQSDFATYVRQTLDNGLDVVACQRKNCRSFGWYLSFPVGAKNGSPHLAHLVEHLALGDMNEAFLKLEYVNGRTSLTNTAFLANGHVDNIETGLQVLGKIFAPLDADERRVLEEKVILVREHVETGYAQHYFQIANLRAIGGDSIGDHYKKPLKNSLSKLTRNACLAFHQEHYTPSTAILTFVSPEPVATTLERIQRRISLDGQSSNRSPALNAWQRPIRPVNFSWYRYNLATVGVWHSLFNPTMAERICLVLVNNFGGRFARLFQSLRTENQLSYAVSSWLGHSEPGLFQLLSLNVNPRHVRKTFDLIRPRFDFTTPPDQEQFSNSILAYQQNLDFIEEDAWQLPEFLAVWNRISDQLVTPEFIRQFLGEFDREMYLQMLKKMFHVSNRHVYLGGMFGLAGWYSAKKFANGTLT